MFSFGNPPLMATLYFSPGAADVWELPTALTTCSPEFTNGQQASQEEIETIRCTTMMALKTTTTFDAVLVRL